MDLITAVKSLIVQAPSVQFYKSSWGVIYDAISVLPNVQAPSGQYYKSFLGVIYDAMSALPQVLTRVTPITVKKFYEIVHRGQYYKTFTAVIYGFL